MTTPANRTAASTPAADRVAGLLPGLIRELSALVAIPSVAFPGFPAEPVHQMSEAVVDLFKRSGAPARLLEIPGGYPAVWAEIPAPADRIPTTASITSLNSSSLIRRISSRAISGDMPRWSRKKVMSRLNCV